MKAQALERRKPGPKPGFVPAVNQRRAAAKPSALTLVTPPAAAQPTEPVHKDPLQRARLIKTMTHVELKAYAKQIGIRQRDIDELTEDRLRQNCTLTVASLIEALTE